MNIDDRKGPHCPETQKVLNEAWATGVAGALESQPNEARCAVATGLVAFREMVHKRGCTPMGEYSCQIPMPINGRICGIDYCIADIVAALNAANIKTAMSCCGHGNEEIARIDLEDGRTLLVRGHSPNTKISLAQPQT